MYVQGKDLKQNDRVRCVSSVNGIVTGQDAKINYVVTDIKDKRGNPLLVNLRTGGTITASPLSVWDTGDLPPVSG